MNVGIGKAFTGVFVAGVALVVACVVVDDANSSRGASRGAAPHDKPDYDSAGTFHTTDLVVDLTSNLGAIGTGSNVGVGVTNINGPTRQTVTIPGGDYNFGELNLQTISGTVPDFPHDLFAFVIRNNATADTTLHTSHSGAIAAEITSTRSAGGNDLTNTAIECSASGGQNNECLHGLAGDVNIDHGNLTVNLGGFIFQTDPAQFLAAAGTIFAEGGGANGIDITSTPTNAIRTRQAAELFDVDNAAASILTFYNASQGTTWIRFGADATPTGGPIISGAPPASATHGAIAAKSSDYSMRITGVGANNSTQVVYSHAFPNGSNCTASPIAHSVSAQFIEPNAAAANVTFNCFTTTTGAAANCDDFVATCIGN